jgi:hypothetical protein
MRQGSRPISGSYTFKGSKKKRITTVCHSAPTSTATNVQAEAAEMISTPATAP